MDIKTFREKRIRSRYLIQSKLFSDIFYALYDGVDEQQSQPVYVLKFHRELVSPHFVDYCIQSLQDYLYQPISGLFELIDFEFDGEDFYIFYKHQQDSLISLDLYLKKLSGSPESTKKRYRLLLKVSQILYSIEQKNLVFGNFSLNNIFMTDNESVVLGPAKVNLICLEYFISNVDVFDGSIFLSPEFLKGFHFSTKTDIYSFGILAFYLVTLKWPYNSQQSLIRLKSCFMDGPVTCSEVNDKISDKLNFFIMKSIQLDSSERWHSFRLIIGILEGKETVKFEKLSNHLKPAESFSSDITASKRSKFGQWMTIMSNIFTVILLMVLIYFGYVSYFKKYDVVQIPDVTEVSLDTVKQTLIELKLKPRTIKYNYHPTIPEGHIIRLEPPVGRSIKQGRVVKLFVSKGRQEIVVPSFIGKTEDEIRFILQGSNLQLEIMPPVFSAGIEFGKVVSQLPLADQYMFDNGKVQLVFSKGSPAKVEFIMSLDDDYQKVSVQFTFTDDLDSVDFQVFEKISEDQLQELYTGVHYGGDFFQEEFIINHSSFIVIKLNGDIIFTNDPSNQSI